MEQDACVCRQRTELTTTAYMDPWTDGDYASAIISTHRGTSPGKYSRFVADPLPLSHQVPASAFMWTSFLRKEARRSLFFGSVVGRYYLADAALQTSPLNRTKYTRYNVPKSPAPAAYTTFSSIPYPRDELQLHDR